jgi:WD40 repeat protein
MKSTDSVLGELVHRPVDFPQFCSIVLCHGLKCRSGWYSNSATGVICDLAWHHHHQQRPRMAPTLHRRRYRFLMRSWCVLSLSEILTRLKRDGLQTKFKPAKIFKSAVEPIPPPTPGGSSRVNAGPRHITAITFDDRGDQVLTASEDETFRLYSCKTGKQVILVVSSIAVHR